MNSENCAYCGLPMGRAWVARPGPPPAEPGYCCFGCRFAASVVQAKGEHGQVNWILARLGFAIFFAMNVMVFAMALWGQDLYAAQGETGQLTTSLQGLFRYLSLLFALPVLLLLGGPLLENALQEVRRGRFSVDLLLLLGVAASYAYSAISVLRDAGPIYFEVGVMVLVLVTLGRWLEASGKLRTTEAIASLQKLLPETACVSRNDGQESEIAVADVRLGDLVRVLPGARIPCDGRVLRTAAVVDEQILTGESSACLKRPGDPVYSGTRNGDGTLWFDVTATADNGAIARIIRLIREALQAKGHYERLADRVAHIFLPVVVLIAFAACVYHGVHSGLDAGLLTGLAVMLIACPCALGIATPLAVWTALGHAAQAQVLFRNGETLERLAGIKAMRFDKTGTLTTGELQVLNVVFVNADDRTYVLRLAGALSSNSTHPCCLAINRFCAEQFAQTQNIALADVLLQAGRGVSATLISDGTRLSLGSGRMMKEAGFSMPERFEMEREMATGPYAVIGWKEHVRAMFIFRETLRSEAKGTIAQLKDLGIECAGLTGDHAARADALGMELGIPVLGNLLPEDKVTAVRKVSERLGPTAMVGDGINDGPALAASTVGIALGCGAEVARDTAMVCLTGNDLRRIPWAIGLARRTVGVIRQNLFWAFGYNIVGLGFAVTGRLNPVLAALAMVLSSFFVLGNSLRLRGGEDELTSARNRLPTMAGEATP